MKWLVPAIVIGGLVIVGWIAGFIYVFSKNQEWNQHGHPPVWAKIFIVVIGGPFLLLGYLLNLFLRR